MPLYMDVQASQDRGWTGARLGRRTVRAVSVALAAALMCLGMVGAASASDAGGQSDLAAARASTAAYHDVANVPSSYADSGLPCFETSAGGMGIHYLDGTALMDRAEDPAHPEALVYAQTADGLKLVAVEYIVPAGLVTEAPSLFGQTFTLEDVPGVPVPLYVLHAWIWEHNPAGMFEDWNPSLDSCR